MLIADYGLWSDFAPRCDPESYLEDARDVDPATCDLYGIAAEFRRAVNAALPGRRHPGRHHVPRPV